HQRDVVIDRLVGPAPHRVEAAKTFVGHAHPPYLVRHDTTPRRLQGSANTRVAPYAPVAPEPGKEDIVGHLAPPATVHADLCRPESRWRRARESVVKALPASLRAAGPRRVDDINALSAFAPLPRVPRPQAITPPASHAAPAGAAGTARQFGRQGELGTVAVEQALGSVQLPGYVLGVVADRPARAPQRHVRDVRPQHVRLDERFDPVPDQ